MTVRTLIISGDDEGPHHSDGTEVCLSIGSVDAATGKLTPLGSWNHDDIHYDDLWLKNPTVVEIQPVKMDDDTWVQVVDPLWAARGLRQALIALTFNPDVRALLIEKAPDMLRDLDGIVNITHDLATFDPPVIQEEPV